MYSSWMSSCNLTVTDRLVEACCVFWFYSFPTNGPQRMVLQFCLGPYALGLQSNPKRNPRDHVFEFHGQLWPAGIELPEDIVEATDKYKKLRSRRFFLYPCPNGFFPLGVGDPIFL